MTGSETGSDEAITKDEIQGEDASKKRKTDAFTELMTPKPKKATGAYSRRGLFHGRMGLGVYLEDPSSFPSSRVIYHTPDFVAINDMFPKATVHTLLLPRSASHNLLHPFDALADDGFRQKVAAETARLEELVARELQRQLGRHSKADAKRQAVLNGIAEPVGEEGLPPGRDWAREVISGVHAGPSMSHLHIHVLSRDLHSTKVKHRKHYNSFTTPFLIPLEEFPLPDNDPRRNLREAQYLQRGMCCWRCGRDFENRFKQLKEHLEQEFEEWKRE